MIVLFYILSVRVFIFQSVGWENAAFVFLNRYLDISEVRIVRTVRNVMNLNRLKSMQLFMLYFMCCL